MRNKAGHMPDHGTKIRCDHDYKNAIQIGLKRHTVLYPGYNLSVAPLAGAWTHTGLFRRLLSKEMALL